MWTVSKKVAILEKNLLSIPVQLHIVRSHAPFLVREDERDSFLQTWENVLNVNI